MKLTTKRERLLTLEMTEAEARQVYELMGNVSGGEYVSRPAADILYSALSKALSK